MTEKFTIEEFNPDLSAILPTVDGGEPNEEITAEDRVYACLKTDNPPLCVAELIFADPSTYRKTLLDIGPSVKFETEVDLALKEIERRS